MRTDPEGITTQHAFLVAWGEYAQQIGLVQKFQDLVLHQKTYQHTPQGKLLEFLVVILAGLPHLKDLSCAAHPIDQDPAVARAWGYPQWADYSGVARSLQRLSSGEAAQIATGLQQVSQPFLKEEIRLAINQWGYLVFDGDLTGLPVSKSSSTYPQVSYGHMNDQIRLGYQASLVSMLSPTYQRLWLSVEHHSGNITSTTQAEGLVRAAEAKSGVAPRRRTDLLGQRLQTLQAQGSLYAEREQAKQLRFEAAREQLGQCQTQLQTCQQYLTEWAEASGLHQPPERPYSQRAKAQQRLQVLQNRILKRQQAQERAQQLWEQAQGQVLVHQEQVHQLQERLVRYEQENAKNSQPVRIIFRLDAGFGSFENLALLIEMGYEVYTKARSAQVVRRLCKLVQPSDAWTCVGQDAQMLVRSDFALTGFPYPVQIALERFTTDKRGKHSAFLYFGPEPLRQDLKRWFDFMNGRQTIEAGIKESKQVFYLHHLKVRSVAALVVQESMVVFAANFIRWACHWMEGQAQGKTQMALKGRLAGCKARVQVGAHTSAQVLWRKEACLLRFTSASWLAGLELVLPRSSESAQQKVSKISLFRWFANQLHKT